MILITDSTYDVHSHCVATALRDRGHAVSFADFSQCGTKLAISDSPSHSYGARLSFEDGSKLSAADVTAVWYRRPRGPQIPSGVTEPEERSFIFQEWGELVESFLTAIDAPFVNVPRLQQDAIKPLQLRLARQAGLRTPDTLITSNPEAANDFISRHNGKVIHKAMTAPRHRLHHTAVVDETALSHLESLRLCPTMFQERVEGPADLRITIVGSRVFAARLESSLGVSPVDSRLDLNVPYEAVKLDNATENSLFSLVQSLGLVYCTIDMKLTHSDELVFFEINPQGQFLYIEILTGLPITNAMADLLADLSDGAMPSASLQKNPCLPSADRRFEPPRL